jgi:hypothetical protein
VREHVAEAVLVASALRKTTPQIIVDDVVADGGDVALDVFNRVRWRRGDAPELVQKSKADHRLEIGRICLQTGAVAQVARHDASDQGARDADEQALDLSLGFS